MDKLISDYQRYMALAEPPLDEPDTTTTATQQQPTQVAELVTEPRNRGPRQGQSSAQQLLREGQLVKPSAQRHQDAPVQTANLRPTRTRVMINDLEQYLQWRRESGRSVSPPTQRMLERATKAVETVREQIPMRGNVRTDIEQTDGEASLRLRVARRTVKPALKQLPLSCDLPDHLKELAISAASAKVTGSGACQEMMHAALLEAGTQLEEKETLVMAVDASIGHGFLRLKSTRDDGTKRVVVLDAWSNGPAVLQEDHACQHQLIVEIPYVGIKSSIDADKAKRVASELVVDYNKADSLVTDMKDELKALKDQGRRLAEDCRYDEKNVTSLHGPINRPQS